MMDIKLTEMQALYVKALRSPRNTKRFKAHPFGKICRYFSYRYPRFLDEVDYASDFEHFVENQDFIPFKSDDPKLQPWTSGSPWLGEKLCEAAAKLLKDYGWIDN